MSTSPSKHVPILAPKMIEALIEPCRLPENQVGPAWIVDCTLGGGGHTGLLLSRLASDPTLQSVRVLAIDQDLKAVEAARVRFSKEIATGRLELRHQPMSELDLRDRKCVGLMADLGFSSDQIEDPARGLSFQTEGPLDMRLNPDRGEPLSQRLRHVQEQELARIIFEYGEERHSRRIAAALIRARREKGLPTTSLGLADLIRQVMPAKDRRGRIHPATRTFQALRIWVNDELGELDQLLTSVINSIVLGGRVAILSFHSLEDRRVKEVFKARDGAFRQMDKKPIVPDDQEIAANPRARSAKLRIAQRVR